MALFLWLPLLFLSSIALLPSLIFTGASWSSQTALNMVLLRQIVNVLPMILAAALLVWIQTRYKRCGWRPAYSFCCFHPGRGRQQSVVAPRQPGHAFGGGDLLFLDLDRQRFGRYFFIAAAACGVAIGIKYEGVSLGWPSQSTYYGVSSRTRFRGSVCSA